MPEAIIILLALACVFWGFIAFAGAAPVMSFHKIQLTELSPQATRKALKLAIGSRLDVDGGWMRDQGIRPLGAFKAKHLAMQPTIVAWQLPGEATYFCIYLIQGAAQSMDWVTIFGDRTLSTGGSRDGQLFPTVPGNWIQTFTSNDAVVLWEQHRAAMDWIQSTQGLSPDRGDEAFEDLFEDELRAQGAHIRSIPLWFVRIPFWYFVRRHTRHGKPIQDLTFAEPEPAF